MAASDDSGRSPLPTYFDWSQWYEDPSQAAESWEQGEILRDLLSALRNLARTRGWKDVTFGADNYFAWVPHEPQVRVSPDVYMIDGPLPEPPPKSWQTWLPGHRPPRWALEIMSEDWRKDYSDNPQKYSQLGCSELVLFDPDVLLGASSRKGHSRVPLTVFRRSARGDLEVCYSGAGPAFSQELKAWLIPCQYGYSARLRVALDEHGEHCVPTDAQRADAEAQRAQTEAHRAQTEAQRADAAVAEANRARTRERELIARLRQAGFDTDEDGEE